MVTLGVQKQAIWVEQTKQCSSRSVARTNTQQSKDESSRAESSCNSSTSRCAHRDPYQIRAPHPHLFLKLCRICARGKSNRTFEPVYLATDIGRSNRLFRMALISLSILLTAQNPGASLGKIISCEDLGSRAHGAPYRAALKEERKKSSAPGFDLVRLSALQRV